MLAVCVVVLGFLNRAHHYYEWDSAQYALGTISFDVAAHRPHPPGYPLWVFMLKIGKLLTRDVNLIATLYGEMFTFVALVAVYKFGRRLMEEGAALLTATALAACSVVTLYMRVGTVYPPDLAASAVLGYWSYRLYHREVQPGFALGLTIAFFLGVRQSGATLMLVLVALAALRAVDFRPLRLWRLAVSASAGVAAWLVPAGMLNGSVSNFLAMARRQSDIAFSYSSVFHGGSKVVHLSHIKIGIMTLLLSCGALAVACLGTAIFSRRDARWRPTLEMLPFWCLWLLPNLVMTFALHLPKPGYLMMSLPPLFLVGGQFIANAAGLARMETTRWVLAGIVVVNLMVPPFIESQQKRSLFDENPWLHALPVSAAFADGGMEAYKAIMTGISADPRRVLVVPMVSNEGPNARALLTEFPTHNVGALAGDGALIVDNGLERRSPSKFDASWDTLLWIARSEDLFADYAEGFTNVRRVHKDRYLSFWIADIPPPPHRARIRQGIVEAWFERESTDHTS